MKIISKKFKDLDYSILTLLSLSQYLTSSSIKRSIFLLLLSLQTAILDVISVASIIPFLSLLINKNNSSSSIGFINFGFFNQFFKLDQTNNLLLSLILLSFIVTISSISRIFTVYYANKLVARIGHELSKLVFKNTFGIDFEYLIKTDLKQTTANLVLYITKTVESLTMLTKLITALLITLSISLYLVITKPLVSITTLLLLLFVYACVGINSRKKMNSLSKDIADGTENQIQTIQEIYGMSRNLYLDDSLEPISSNYYSYDFRNRSLYALSEFLGTYPRFVIEAAAIVVISLITTIFAFFSSNSYNIIPFLGAFAFASQRLLPALQQTYANWAGIKSNDQFVKSIIKSLSSKKKSKNKINIVNTVFTKRISFKNLSFHYPDDKYKKHIINNFSYEFSVGSRVAIIGPTGIGKSSLLDIISCLRNPTKGSIKFFAENNKLLLENNSVSNPGEYINSIPFCSFVPQFNSILNTTIAKNISVGLPYKPINMDDLEFASEISLLSNFISKQKDKFQFNPTSNGYLLSGGQIQRIAIARAIYKMSPIMLLDESTSALDKNTAEKIIDNIFSLEHIKFIFAVTHSSEILHKFTHILEIKQNGNLVVREN